MIETRNLRRTGANLSILGFGGAAIGELLKPVPEEQALATVSTAIGSCISYFDTLPWYGRGLSEHRIGAAFRGKSSGSLVLSTKVGRILSAPRPGAVLDPSPWAGGLAFAHRHEYSYDGITRSFEDSQQRLGSTRVDLLVIHDLDHWHHGTDVRVDAYMHQLIVSGWRALEELKACGTISGIGGGINQPGTTRRFLDAVDVDFFLVALCYTLLDQTILMALAEERGAGFIIGGVFSSGILATGARTGVRYNDAPADEKTLTRVALIESVCHDHRAPLLAAALQFPLGHPAVASVIPGAVPPQKVESSVRAIATPISSAFWDDLISAGALEASMPVPGRVSNSVFDRGKEMAQDQAGRTARPRT